MLGVNCYKGVPGQPGEVGDTGTKGAMVSS